MFDRHPDGTNLSRERPPPAPLQLWIVRAAPNSERFALDNLHLTSSSSRKSQPLPGLAVRRHRCFPVRTRIFQTILRSQNVGNPGQPEALTFSITGLFLNGQLLPKSGGGL